jgi:hypothetical protein
VEVTDSGHGRLVQDGRTVGHVSITAPDGADEHALSTNGPSTLGQVHPRPCTTQLQWRLRSIGYMVINHPLMTSRK